MLVEILEHFGGGYPLFEPETVGTCQACSGDIFDYEFAACEDCGEVHKGCKVECANPECSHEGCKKCMLYDENTGEYFCDTSSYNQMILPDAEKLQLSECYQNFIQGELENG